MVAHEEKDAPLVDDLSLVDAVDIDAALRDARFVFGTDVRHMRRAEQRADGT